MVVPVYTLSCVCVCVKPFQSCLTLCDPTDSSLPGSSVHGILQARILEWVAMPFSGDLLNSNWWESWWLSAIFVTCYFWCVSSGITLRFESAFTRWLPCWALFHMCMGHLDSCFCEVSVQGFCPISSWMSIFSYWFVGVPYIYWMISWFSLVQSDFLVFIFMLGISLFSGILFTMNLRLMFIKTWKSSTDTWLEEVTLFQGWSPKMCICSMDLESHLEPATSQVTYSGKCQVALALCLLPYYKGRWNQWWIYRFRSEWV